MKKLALVTGGQKGIGLGISSALIDAGWSIAIASSSLPDAPDVVDALKKLGTDARYYQHDLTRIEDIGALLDRIEDQQGEIFSLVSNAGVPARVRGDMLEIKPENFDFVLDVNLRGAFFLAQQCATRMLANKNSLYRSIVFVTSVSATLASIERAEYCISKSGAAMMVQLFAARLAGDGIGVFEIRPGIIETGMTSGVKDKYTAKIESGLVPAKRWGQPRDIGRAVLPLLSGEFAFSNGSVLSVDGGLSLARL